MRRGEGGRLGEGEKMADGKCRREGEGWERQRMNRKSRLKEGKDEAERKKYVWIVNQN